MEKGYLITVHDAHKVEQRSDKEWYLPHHPVTNLNKPGKVRRVLNGAAKFHGTSLNKSLILGPDLLQNLINVLPRFRQHQFAVSADIEGIFLRAVAFLRAQVSTSSGPKTELAFVLGKTREAPMKVMTIPNLELQAALLAARLKQDICRALTVHINKVFMWTDSTTVLQWLNSTSKQPKLVANRVCEILEHTSVDEWNHVASSDNPADAGNRGMSAEVLQSSSWVRGSDFLRTKQFPFEPSTEVVNNIKLGIVTKETDKTNTLAASVTKSTKEPPPQLIPFDKYSSYQELLRITAYALRLLPSHECYRNADGSIIDPTELGEAERHLQYLVQGESFNAERKNLLENKPVKRSSRIAPISPFIGPNSLIRSAGRIKRLVEVDFDVKHPIVLDARHAFVKLFLRHNHFKHHRQGIDNLRAKLQEHYTVLKLRAESSELPLSDQSWLTSQ